MKLYTSPTGPNPRAMRMIVGFKEMDIETTDVDMMAADNRKPEFLKINPAGQLPCLELDDGTVIAEVAAIAEYLEELKPDPVLCGADAVARAQTRMWMRRADYMVIAPMAHGFRHGEGKKFFAPRFPIHEDISAPSKAMGREGLAWFDAQLKGRQYLCGDRISYADMIFFSAVDFFAGLGQPLDEALGNLGAYMKRLADDPRVGGVE